MSITKRRVATLLLAAVLTIIGAFAVASLVANETDVL